MQSLRNTFKKQREHFINGIKLLNLSTFKDNKLIKNNRRCKS